jgi:hypothetical protein
MYQRSNSELANAHDVGSFFGAKGKRVPQQ